jgi:hypothetical protein
MTDYLALAERLTAYYAGEEDNAYVAMEAAAALRDAHADKRRLLFVRDMMDGIGDIDLHEEAAINASALGRDEPNDDDYLAAIRTAINAALREEQR